MAKLKPHFLEFETKLYRPLDDIFNFFSRAENLDEVTPDDLGFSILTPLPISMKVGTLIDYRITLMGVPFFWRTMISDWEPPYRFVDQQLKGPYVFWHHEHTFKQCDGYVLMTDRVHYLSPGGVLEPLVDSLFVRGQLNKMWKFRGERFAELFGEKTQNATQTK